jgi:hypothetical protein
MPALFCARAVDIPASCVFAAATATAADLSFTGTFPAY